MRSICQCYFHRIIIACIFILLLFSNSLYAQVTAGSSIVGFFNNSSSASISYNNTSGSNKILIVGVTGQQPGAFVSGVTYNGIPMNQLVNHFNSSQTRVNVWYLVNPPVGTFNVVVNNSQSDNGVIGVTSFSGVDQAIPFGAVATGQGNGTSATVTVSSAANQLVYSLTAFNNGIGHTPAGGQTELWDNTINSSVSGSANTRAGAASVNMSVTSTSAPWSMVGVGLRPATTPGGSAIWHQADLQENTATSGSATVSRPTNLSAGDLILVILSDRDNPTITPPTGFNLIRLETGGNDNAQVAAYWKIATASEPTSYTFTRSTNRNWRATAVRITNFNAANPIGSNNGANLGSSGNTSLSVPGFTTAANDALVIAAVAFHNTVGSINEVSGMTSRWANLTPRPGNGGATQVYPSIGATGSKSLTWTSSVRAAGILFEINAFQNIVATPGGVSGANLWLKANEKTSTSTNGSAVSLWEDASGNLMNASRSTNQPVYRAGNSAQGINFNPSISFNGTSNYFDLPTGFENFTQGVSAFTIINTNFGGSAQPFARIFHLSSGGNNNLLSFNRNNTSDNVGFEVWGASSSLANAWTTTTPLATANGTSLIGYRIQSGTSGQTSRSGNIYVNGASVISTSSAATPITVSRTLNRIGYGNGSEYINGYIPEIILFNRDISATERQRVNSYLALKYGVTLDQNYLASNGTTVYWNTTTNSGNNLNIAGIVRDDSSALNQKQSRSINAGLQVTIGNGNTISTTNQDNIQNFLSDKSALVWGNNNGAITAWTNTGAPSGYQIIARNWRVQETGTVGSVRVQVADNSGSNGLPDEGTRSVVMLVNSTNNFSTGSTVVSMTLNGTNWEANFDFSSGQYFTFAACEVGPVVFNLGTTSNRCQGAAVVTYTATAQNSTGITYSLDTASLVGGNTINSSTGAVTYVAGWSGTSVITANATGCTNAIGAHTVTINPSVGTPVFTLGANSQRCRAAGTVTYTATASNTTGITYSLDATSLAAGNTINSSTGLVTYVASWSGTSIITASAAGCSGPVIATHQASSSVIFAVDDAFTGVQGVPLAINVLTNDLCNINSSTVTIVSSPGLGFLQNNGNGQFTYLPLGDFIGDITFTYRVCSNAPVVCDTALVTITILEKNDDPCFEANLKKLYYMPFPENETQLRTSLWSAASVSLLTANARNIISISVPYPRTVIVYDHWEDGYESNIENPQQSTSLVWGDGNPANGVAPGYPTDIVPPGGFIILDSTFAWNRPTSTVLFDGRDKIYSSAAISVTKVTGDGGFTGQTRLFDVQNVKTNVPDVSRYGQFFILPFGENVTLGGTSAFRYTGLFVSASENGTIVQLDYNGDGVVDTVSPVLNDGQVWFYNGAATTPGVNNTANVNTTIDIKAGARVISNKAVGVNMVFGGIDSYGTRNLPVFPSQFYGNSYISSVYSTDAATPVYAFFVNPNPNQITINWTRAVGAPTSGSFTVAANNGINYFDINTATGMRFQSAGGEPFTAVGIIDADAAGSTYDWAFNMIPVNRLTDFATIAWAPGSSNGSANYNPVWVTPSQTTTVYVKYDGNLTTGPKLSPCIARYDTSFVVNALESRLIFGLNNDNSGMGVYNCDSVPMSLAWGQRPFGGTPTGSPATDVGYTMDPKCLKKLVFATDDRYVTGQNTAITFDVRGNDAAYLTLLDSASVSVLGFAPPSNGSIVINPNRTITYTPNLGFIGNDQFDYRICAEFPDDNICDVATVFISVPCANVPGQNVVRGVVFTDVNLNGVSNPGETGINSIAVNLYNDLNANGIKDVGETLEQTTNTVTNGSYSFTISQDLRFRDEFNTNGSATGNNGTVNFAGNWTKIVETGNFGTNNIQVVGNALRIAGNGATSQIGARRQMNLTGAIQATFTYDFNKSAFSSNTNDWVDVQVATSDAGPWATLARFTGLSASTGSASFDITNWISSTTNIRFVESTDAGFATTENVTFDNVQIRYFINTNYVVEVAPPANTYNITAPAIGNSFAVTFAGVNNGNCNSNFGFAQADLAVQKLVNVARPQIGDTINYTIRLINNGPTNATGVVVNDLLPAGMNYVSHTATSGTYNNVNGNWSVPSVLFPSTDSLIIRARVTTAALPLVWNKAEITASNQIDIVAANNKDSVLVTPYRNSTYAVNDENSTWVNVPVGGNVTTNDFDIEGHIQTFGSFLNPTSTGNISSGATVSGIDANGNPVANAGTLSFDANGNYTYTPAPGFTGVMIVPYRICDNGIPVACDTAKLEITVSPLPYNSNSVIANNDEYFSFGNPINANVFINDADPQGDNFSLTSYRFDSNGDGVPNASGSVGIGQQVGGVNLNGVAVLNAGTLTLQSNGALVFVPAPGFVGQVNLNYTICDNGTPQACDIANVVIQVIENPNGILNDPPIAGDDFAYTNVGVPVVGNFAANDYDLNGDSISFNGVTIRPNGPASSIATLSTVQGGTVEMFANGTFLYTPPVGYTGPDRVAYEICDVTIVEPQPLCADATIHLLVGSQNTTVAVNDQNSTWVNVPVGGDVTTNDFDPEGHTQSFGSFLNANASGNITSGSIVNGVDANGNPIANAGTLTFDANGVYVYTPALDFVGSISVPYTICDNGYPVACDTAVLQISVSPFSTEANSVIANNDEYYTFGTPVVGNVLTNDADPQGDDFVITTYLYDSNGDGTPDAIGALSAVQQVGGKDQDGNAVPNAGQLTIDNNGAFVFVPEPGFAGTVELLYTICDDATPQACDNAVVTITVLRDQNGLPNDPPFAGDDFAYTNVNVPVTGNFSGNDYDLNDDPISVNGITIDPNGPATSITTLTTIEGGTVEIFANGTFLYTPANGYVGPDRVVYEICDVTIIEPQPLCADATIYLLIGAQNSTYAVNDENSTWQEVPVSGDVTTNDFDLEGHIQTFGSFLDEDENPLVSGGVVSGINSNGNPVANAGTITFDANGNYTYTPAAGFTGIMTVPYNVCDNGTPVACAVAVLEITVTPFPYDGNSVIANNDEYFSFGDPINADVFVNDADPQGDNFTLTAFVFDSNGDGTPNTAGTVGTPTPVAGVDQNGNPVANAGTLTLNANGTLTFVPTSGFEGQVFVDYTITDDNASSATDNAQIVITVITDQNGPANDPPVATDDFAYTNVNVPVAGNFTGNDYDLNGDPISVLGITIDPNGPATSIVVLNTAQGGTVELFADGTFLYTSPTGYVGPDLVEYVICDVTTVEPQPLCAAATIHLLVGTQNTTNAVNDENSTWQEVPVSGDVTTNDFDLEGHTQTFGSFLNPAGITPIASGSTVSGVDANGDPVANAGTITFDANGNYTYTPAVGFTGIMTVPYNVCDNGTPVACALAVLEITVTPFPYNGNSVIANNDEYFTFGAPISSDLFVNDADPEGDNFDVDSYLYDSNGDGTADASGTLGSPVNVGGVRADGTPVANAGSLTLNTDGTFTFTPVSGFIGEVTLEYTIEDDGSPVANSTATVTITVLGDGNGPQNDPPVATDDFSYTTINTPVTGNFSGNDYDLNGDPISVNGTTINTGGPATPVDTLTTAEGGTVVIRANGTYVYTPPTGYTGPDRVVYEICDVTNIQPEPLCAQATIHLLVGTSNTTNAVNDENSTWVNTPASGNVTTNDYDIEGHTQTFGSFLNQINLSTFTSGSIVRGTDPNGSPVLNAGTLTFLGDGSYTYTPATGFIGTISIPYSICDNGYPSVCDTAYLEITVSPLPTTANSVIANNDEYSTYGDPVNGDLSLNDADPQGDDFSVISYLFDNNGDGIPNASGSVGAPVSVGGVRIDGTPVTNAGTLTLNSDGTFTFTPVDGFIGEVTLTYTIEDDAAIPATSTATVVINVLGDPNGPVNDPPVAGDDFIYTAINVIKTGNFTGNDYDLNGDPISVNGTTINTVGPSTPVDTLTTAQGGTVILNANGTYTYIPPTNYVGPDYVVYEICDVTVIAPQPLCTQATIHMLIGSGVIIEGLVWQDADGSITLNGAETGTTANTSLYINVSDASGRVVAVSQVNTNGTYSINNVPSYSSLTATLSTTPGTIGQSSPAPSLPAGWVNTGQNNNGDIITSPLGVLDFTSRNDTVKNLDFGIELIPTAQDFFTNLVFYIIIDSAGNIDTTQLNYLEVLPSYFITDDVDGTVDSVRLTTFPQNVVRVNVNGNTYTSATWPENGIMLPVDTAGKPVYTNFWVYPDTTAQPTIVIPFMPKDNARQMGNPAIITLGYNSVLPVELISFEAVKNGCQVDLKWVTASEMNNDIFIVYRSLDAINWQPIGSVKGNGTTPLPNSYSFTDSEPLPTTIYYRLLQRDFDGANEWLPIRSVDMTQCGQAEARVYPVPASNVLYLDMASAPLKDSWIVVYSSKGDIVMREHMSGTNRKQLDVSKLAGGSYILEWTDGISRNTFKVIITR